MSSAKTAKNVVESLREIVQDLLVPELKAVKVSVDSLHQEMGSLRNEMGALRSEMKVRDEKQSQAIQHLSEKLDFAIDIRERLASLEARMPRQ
jgi:hypothetical protein